MKLKLGRYVFNFTVDNGRPHIQLEMIPYNLKTKNGLSSAISDLDAIIEFCEERKWELLENNMKINDDNSPKRV